MNAKFAIESSSIIGALQLHSIERGSSPAFYFLNSDSESVSITFGELAQRVRQLGDCLGDLANPGDRAVLMYPSGLDFIESFLACLSVGIVAVPAFPPKKNRNSSRVKTILNDLSLIHI